MFRELFTTFNHWLWMLFLLLYIPAQLQAYIVPNTGCHHNGTWYADKSLVPTTEKCLNCQCQKKTLVCRLKVCPEMPLPPPRGCVVVQKKNTCCPYLTCARLEAFYKIPATRRIIAYLDHYERESIDRAVNENMLQRRSDDTDTELHVCVKNGTVYKSGSAMSSSNLCSYCYCIGGTEKCVKPKCMLPVEGCKPIFVDSTCCPVRYDCSSKSTGKSSQEVRSRKTSNKHFLRMSQRMQRNRGCTVHQQFYAEGQKMKSDPDKPCDICFCIRGHRKCAPKKCAPALKNCIPVVPKGQCCPSSYDCGSQRDYRRVHNSRQFNLFSLLFGKDDSQEQIDDDSLNGQYPYDKKPLNPDYEENSYSTTEQQLYERYPLSTNSEKSIFDAIREGLEFIDSNGNDMMIKEEHSTPKTLNTLPHLKNHTSSDLENTSDSNPLLQLTGSSNNLSNESHFKLKENLKTQLNQSHYSNKESLSWIDVLLGTEPDLEDKNNDIKYKTNLTESSLTALNQLDVENHFLNKNLEQFQSLEELNKTLKDTTQILKEAKITKIPNNESQQKKQTNLTTTTTVTPTNTNASSLENYLNFNATVMAPISGDIQNNPPLEKNPPSFGSELQTEVGPNTEKNTGLLAALLDGLSDILKEDNNNNNHNKTENNKLPTKNTFLPPTSNLTVAQNTSNKLTIFDLPTPKPMPAFRPMPLDKTYTRINSKITNMAGNPPVLSTKKLVSDTNRPTTSTVLTTNEKLSSFWTLLERNKPTTTKTTTTNNAALIKEATTLKKTTMTPTTTTLSTTKTIPSTTTTTAMTAAPKKRPTTVSNDYLSSPTTTTTNFYTKKPFSTTLAATAETTTTTTTTTLATFSKPTPTTTNTSTRKYTFIPPATTTSMTTVGTHSQPLTTYFPPSSTIATTTATITAASSTLPTTRKEVSIAVNSLATTTPKPMLIKTNPTILEAEPLDRNAQPTLPPSLPNLKIIPFLPTDAVQAAPVKPNGYNYYQHNAAASGIPATRIDFNLYDDTNLYPSITEKYPLYSDLEEGAKTEYIYKFNVEGPIDSSVSSTAGKFDGSIGSTAYVNYDFGKSKIGVISNSGNVGGVGIIGVGNQKTGIEGGKIGNSKKSGFSPPTKTEGGFLPKEPLILDNENKEIAAGLQLSGDNTDQQFDNKNNLNRIKNGVSSSLIDITTASFISNNKHHSNTQIIEITTSDPFKDVIRTEPPPDLTSLIEDKLKNLLIVQHEDSDITPSSTTLPPHQSYFMLPTNFLSTVNVPPPEHSTNGFTVSVNDLGPNHRQTSPVFFDHALETTPWQRSVEEDGIKEEEKKSGNEIESSKVQSTRIAIDQPEDIKKGEQLTIKPTIFKTTSSTQTTKATLSNEILAKATTLLTMSTNKTTTTTIKPTIDTLNDNTTTTTTTIKPTTSLEIMSTTTAIKPTTDLTTKMTLSTTLWPIHRQPTMKTQLPQYRNKTLAKPYQHNKPLKAKPSSTVTTVQAGIGGGAIGSGAVKPPKNMPVRRFGRPKPVKNHKPVATTMKITAITTPATLSTTHTTPVITTLLSLSPHLESRLTTPTSSLSTNLEQKIEKEEERIKNNNNKPPFTNFTRMNSSSLPTTDIRPLTVSAVAPLLNSPFDKLPFVDASVEVKRPQQQSFTTTTSAKLQQPANSTTTTTELGITAVKIEPVSKILQSPSYTLALKTSTTSKTSLPLVATHNVPTNLMDPIGILKLAGCNIYGRMYRVGRIILELSNACLECRCTETGVKCGPLDC